MTKQDSTSKSVESGQRRIDNWMQKNENYFVVNYRNYGGARIGLYTPINYFGRYATCSHKDGGRSIFSLGKPLARRTT